jgi:hypothetical protein
MDFNPRQSITYSLKLPKDDLFDLRRYRAISRNTVVAVELKLHVLSFFAAVGSALASGLRLSFFNEAFGCRSLCSLPPSAVHCPATFHLSVPSLNVQVRGVGPRRGST